MIEVKAPESYEAYQRKHAIFLAGSIEMGVAEDWQKKVVDAFRQEDVLLLNPRRQQWDPSWEQSIDNPVFREQVEWELNALSAADTILTYFAPNTKSPITLMEVGIHASESPEKMVVCCPDGFWRKGNVDIVCRRFGVQQVPDIDTLIEAVKRRIKKAA